jgi:neurotransmitter:Na+ symporter, NSS family
MPKQREHWSTHIGFILAAAGSAIGLGTLWKFPYVIGENGGGLFVLFFFLFIFLIGIPVFMAELMLGRKAQRGAVGIFSALSNDSTVWKGAGWLGVISSFLIMSFYGVVAGWGMNYILMSLNQSYENLSAIQVANKFDLLVASGDITLFWHFLFTSLTIGVVYAGVRNGIEYWTKFMTVALFLMLIFLCLYSIRLEGFKDAVRFLLFPEYKEFNFASILEALGLSFFTLSLGQGIMLTYGSYMRESEDIPKTAIVIALMILLTAIMAGLTIFSVVFTFGFSPQEGSGLIFKTLPLLFARLPGSLLVSTTFFILLVFTALTSSVALVEVVVANFMDLLQWSRRKATLISGAACFIFGIPSALSGTGTLFGKWEDIYGKTFFETVNDLVSVWFLPIDGLMIALFAGWFLNKEISREELSLRSSWRWIYCPWRFFIRWIAPIGIVCVLLQKTKIIDFDAFIQNLLT